MLVVLLMPGADSQCHHMAFKYMTKDKIFYVQTFRTVYILSLIFS